MNEPQQQSLRINWGTMKENFRFSLLHVTKQKEKGKEKENVNKKN